MGRFYVRTSVHPFVRPFVHSPLLAIQPGLRPSQPSLKHETWLAGWLGLKPGWLGLRPGWLGLRPGWLGLRPGWMAQRGGRMDKRMDGRKISPFYRTSSPIGAAAQKPDNRWKELFNSHKIRASAIFYLFWFRSYGLSKVHNCMVIVGFETFRPFHFGWL